ncbi:hypothetical protein ATANTOWER_025525 [Ataeniobius toweri]|uniref:Uncharacterized protein n=1 Tax=Ataeniobius toweri TaxID=208326 RepID=A0ABU7AHC9_9TELE|nr:hypothetical protein [Ataeniobius toweri]
MLLVTCQLHFSDSVSMNLLDIPRFVSELKLLGPPGQAWTCVYPIFSSDEPLLKDTVFTSALKGAIMMWCGLYAFKKEEEKYLKENIVNQIIKVVFVYFWSLRDKWCTQHIPP